MSKKLVTLWGFSLVVGLAACGVAIFFAQQQGLDPARLTGDAKGYVLLAENIYNHQVFSFSREEPFMPDSFRAPGYPAFLAALFAIFHSWIAVLLVQAALVSVVPVLLYILLRPYHERAAWWGAILFTLEPIRLFASSTLLSDALFTCLFLGSLVLLAESARRRSYLWIAATGLVLGIAVLVRPIAEFLPLLYVGYLLVARVPWRQLVLLSLLLVATMAVVIAPWMARNHALFNTWSISSVGSYNLAAYNAPEYMKYHPTPEGLQTLQDFEGRQSRLPTAERLSLARAGEFSAVFWSVVRGHEADYAFFHIFKTIPFFLTDGLRDTVRLFGVELSSPPNITSAVLSGKVGELVAGLRQGGLAVALLVVGSGFWLCVVALYLFGVYTLLRKKMYPLVFLLVGLVFYFALLTGPVSNARYRVPVEGFLLVAAAVALFELKSRWYDKASQ